MSLYKILRRVSHRCSGSQNMVDVTYFKNICFLIKHLRARWGEKVKKLGQWPWMLAPKANGSHREAELNYQPWGGPWQAEPSPRQEAPPHDICQHRCPWGFRHWGRRSGEFSLLSSVDVYPSYKNNVNESSLCNLPTVSLRSYRSKSLWETAKML